MNKSKNETKKTIPFIKHQKQKYLGMNLTKKVQDYKISLKQVKDLNKWKDI